MREAGKGGHVLDTESSQCPGPFISFPHQAAGIGTLLSKPWGNR